MKFLNEININGDKVVTSEEIDNIQKEINNKIALNKTTLGYTKKNLLKVTALTQTKNGVTLTINSNGSITVNGTATADAVFYLTDYQKLVYGENYILSGCPEGGSASKYRLYIMSRTDWSLTAADVGNSMTFTASNSEYFTVRLTIYNGNTVNNLVFKPMIRLADITDDIFEPYIDDINTRIIENKSDIVINQSTLGYQIKNLIKYISYTTRTIDGVTFNVNSDNTITINGTSTSRYCDFYIYGWYNSTSTVLSKTGDYTISMGDNFANSGIVAYIIVNGTWAVKEFTTSSTNYTITDNTSTHITCLMIRVPEGVTVNNITVYPMIRYSFITDNTYEPYIPSINEKFNNYLPLSGGTINGNITANNLKDSILLYSGAPATPNATITIDGLFTNYSVISVIAIVGDFTAEDSYRSATVSLSSIKTQSMTSDDFNIKYVDDNNINIFSGMYSGAPSYVSLKIYAVR